MKQEFHESFNSFRSPKDLANYLGYLNENDEEYEKYLSWKKAGPQESFLKLLELAQVDSRCRLCKHIANLRMQ